MSQFAKKNENSIQAHFETFLPRKPQDKELNTKWIYLVFNLYAVVTSCKKSEKFSISICEKTPDDCLIKMWQTCCDNLFEVFVIFLKHFKVIWKISDPLRDLVSFVQFLKSEHTHGGKLLLAKLQAEVIILSWVFFAFFKLYKWCQMVPARLKYHSLG